MVTGNINIEPVLSVVVVNMGMGSKVLNESKKIGINGGTIFLGRGTVKKPILELLGLDEAKRKLYLWFLIKNLKNDYMKN